MHEKVWAEEWARENEDWQILDKLVSDKYPKDTVQPDLVKVPLSVRERRIVATVVQWMGTNVGSSFVDRVLKKIETLKKDPDRCQGCGDPHPGRGPCPTCKREIGSTQLIRIMEIDGETVALPSNEAERIRAIEVLTRGSAKSCTHGVCQPTIKAAIEVAVEEHEKWKSEGDPRCNSAKFPLE